VSSEENAGRRKVDVSVTQRIGPWQVELAWPDAAFQVGPVSITVTPADDATDDELMGGLSSTVLRQIDFPQARLDWRAEVVARSLDDGESGPTNPQQGIDGVTTDGWRAKGLQEALARDGVADGYLALLAEAYIVLVKRGDRSIAATLAEMTGRSPDTMKQHLHRVRKAGMLTSIPGKAGGRLTPKAIKTLRETVTGRADCPASAWDHAEQMAAEYQISPARDSEYFSH